ncbi:MAG: TetR/AcrR family transcriptional regulator [Cycloclasticus sp.]|nr:TetR/AcrR family transcriptional regulator [Cycloclasticus sp.]
MELNNNKETLNTRDYILEQAIPMFAAQGYNGVSMRDLSKAVGLSAASLYHHFKDKNTLYLEMVKHVFSDKAAGIIDSINPNDTAFNRLEHFIGGFTQLLDSDPDFRSLVLWELLNDDENRLQVVAEEVVLAPFTVMDELLEELAPGEDHYMLLMSIIWSLMSHFETAPMCRYLPGWKTQYSEPKTVAKHLMLLITSSLKLNANTLN